MFAQVRILFIESKRSKLKVYLYGGKVKDTLEFFERVYMYVFTRFDKSGLRTTLQTISNRKTKSVSDLP